MSDAEAKAASAAGGKPLTAEQKRIWEANQKAYTNMLLSTTGEAFGLVQSSKTEDLGKGDSHLAWKHLNAKYEPKDSSSKIEVKLSLIHI